MTKNKVKIKKKVNSYIKILLWMCLGGVIGAVVGLGTFAAEGNLQTAFADIRMWIGTHTVLLLAVLFVLSVVISIVCYRKEEGIVGQYLNSNDDEQQEELDRQYDFWGNIGMTGSTVLLYLSIAIFAFGLWGKGKEGAVQILIGAVFFLLAGAVCAIYQVATVKQIQKKDPMKHGDAADLRFQKDWIRSCDEVEKRVIYEASYKAYTVGRTLLLVAVCICILGEMYFGGCLTAIVMLTICNIVMTLVYSYHVNRLGKLGLNS